MPSLTPASLVHESLSAASPPRFLLALASPALAHVVSAVLRLLALVKLVQTSPASPPVLSETTLSISIWVWRFLVRSESLSPKSSS